MPRASTLDVVNARRIVIQGVTGAGKSTAAREWAAMMNVQVIDYDNDVLWMPAALSPWTQYSPEQQRERVRGHMRAGAWVMASCGSRTTDIVYPQTDVIVYLDYSPLVTFTRLFKRTMGRALRGETCCNGNKESLRLALLSKDSIFLWWLQTWRERRNHARSMEEDATMPPVYRLTHPRQFQELLSTTLASMPTIYGDTLDEAGRCTHYHSDVDVIANKCAICNKYWACYKCHAAAADHSFGAMDLQSRAVMCGACGHEMNFDEYAGSTNGCPRCGQRFNPGCSLHRHIYFQLD